MNIRVLAGAPGVVSLEFVPFFRSSIGRFYHQQLLQTKLGERLTLPAAGLPFFSSSGSLSFMINSNNVAPRLLNSSGVLDLKNQSNLQSVSFPLT